MGQPTRLSVSVGVTRNLGDFNSLRVDISLEDEPREGETVSAAYARLRKKVFEEVDRTVEEATK